MTRNRIRTVLAAALLAASTGALAQADNTNSATDPTYYGGWHWWNPSTAPRVYREEDYSTPRVYIYGPTVTYRGPAYYEQWRYYDPPVTYFPAPGTTPLGTVTAPDYMGPRDVTP